MMSCQSLFTCWCDSRSCACGCWRMLSNSSGMPKTRLDADIVLAKIARNPLLTIDQYCS